MSKWLKIDQYCVQQKCSSKNLTILHSVNDFNVRHQPHNNNNNNNNLVLAIYHLWRYVTLHVICNNNQRCPVMSMHCRFPGNRETSKQCRTMHGQTINFGSSVHILCCYYFLQRIRIARNAEHCTRGIPSVCLSFHHVPVLCPEE